MPQTRAWRLSEANEDFSLCPSYPRAVIVPRAVDDDALARSARFRQGGRFPVLSYYHAPRGTVSPTPPQSPPLGPSASLLALLYTGRPVGCPASARAPALFWPRPLSSTLPSLILTPPLSLVSESRQSLAPPPAGLGPLKPCPSFVNP